MMQRYLVFFGLVIFALPAMAQSIFITQSACEQMVAHRADDNVTYEPGVDVDGNAVEDAELYGRGMPWPQDLSIPLRLDLQEALGLSTEYVAPEAVLGTIEYKNEKLTFNGEPVTDRAAALLAEACEERVDFSPINTQNPDILMQ